MVAKHNDYGTNERIDDLYDDYLYSDHSDYDEPVDDELLDNIIEGFDSRLNSTVQITENSWNVKNTLNDNNDDSIERSATPLYFDELLRSSEKQDTNPKLNSLKANEKR